MQKLYFIALRRTNAMIADTILPGHHISFNGYTFEQVSRPPRGRTIRQRLINEDKQERILIYG